MRMLNQLQNLEAVDARQIYPKEYGTWREDPENFCVNGVYPIRNLWETSREAWKEILQAPVNVSTWRSTTLFSSTVFGTLTVAV